LPRIEELNRQDAKSGQGKKRRREKEKERNQELVRPLSSLPLFFLLCELGVLAVQFLDSDPKRG
jgi:hypothetical protein